MKDIKRRFEFFHFYDKTGIETHLAKMAEQGWLLEKMSALRWTYRRIEPRKIHFAVSYYATISDFEPEPTEEQQAFNDFCEHSGWKIAASTVQMQVFYNENDDPVPIETDPMLEIQNLQRKFKKTMLPSYILLLVCSLLLGTMFISSLLGDPIRLLSSANNMFMGIWFVVAFTYTLTELITYFAWRRKAMRMAEQGIFMEKRGHRLLGYAVMIILLVSVIIYLISLGSSAMQFFITAFLLVFLAGFAVVNGIKNLLKKRKVKAGANMVLTSIASFALAFVLMGAVNFITIRGIQSGIFEDGYNDLPIKIGELLQIDDSDYLQTHGIEDSIFLGQDESSQHPNSYYHSPSMQYTITEVKMPFLYDFVVDTLYHHYDEWKGWNSTYEYVEADAVAWGASKAWELYRDGETDNRFLVCYDKYILEIAVDWELTEEQMRMIGDKMCGNDI